MAMKLLVQVTFGALLCSSAWAAGSHDTCSQDNTGGCSGSQCSMYCNSTKTQLCYTMYNTTLCDCSCVNLTSTDDCSPPTNLVDGYYDDLAYCRNDTQDCSNKYRVCTYTKVSDTEDCCNCRCIESLDNLQECGLQCPNVNETMLCVTDRAPYNNTITCQCKPTPVYEDVYGYNATSCQYYSLTTAINCSDCTQMPAYYDSVDVCYGFWFGASECVSPDTITTYLQDFCDYAIYIYDYSIVTCNGFSTNASCYDATVDSPYAYCGVGKC